MTPNMIRTLVRYSHWRLGRCVNATRGGNTMVALRRLGFAEWHDRLGNKYGRSHWWITDAGVAEALKHGADPVVPADYDERQDFYDDQPLP